MRPKFALIFGLLVLAAAGSTRAEDRGLKPYYDFVVEVDGVTDTGWQIMAGPVRTRMLLVSPPGDQAMMMSIPEKSVRPVDTKLLLKHDGVVDVLAGAASATRIIPLVQAGGTVSFTLDGRTLVLKPRPPLLGPHTVDDLVKDRPNFGDGIKTYKPDVKAVSYLKGYAKPTEIEIYFGSWCPVCEAWVPKLLKTVQDASNEKIQVNLIGLARDFDKNPQLAREKGIHGLPTFIIRQGGIEVGRLVGAPQTGTIEGQVADVLRAKEEPEKAAPAAATPSAPSTGAQKTDAKSPAKVASAIPTGTAATAAAKSGASAKPAPASHQKPLAQTPMVPASTRLGK